MDNQESAPSGKDRFVTRKAVGERITFLREARGLSQKALSDELAKLGLVVRRETITQWENGTRDLKTEYLARLSEFFGVSSDWLLGLTGAPERTPAAADELGLSYKAVDALRPKLRHLSADFTELLTIGGCAPMPVGVLVWTLRDVTPSFHPSKYQFSKVLDFIRPSTCA